MEFLKNRRNAKRIAAAVIVLCFFFGTGRSIRREIGKVEALFYSGVEGRVSINAQLAKKVNESHNLLSVADDYKSVLGSLPDNLRAAGETVTLAADPASKYKANESLTAAASDLTEALSQCDLTAQQRDVVTEANQNMENIDKAIAKSGYNDAVDEFNNTVLRAFPASVMKGITGAGEAEAFR